MSAHPDPLTDQLARAVERMDRRQVTKLLAGACLLPLVGCDDTSEGADMGGLGGMGGMGGGSDGAIDGAAAPDAGQGPDAGQDPDAGQEPDAGDDPDAAPAADAWATGGTAAMVDKARYPDPFTAALATCALVASTTEGPCTTATELLREDISEGWDGLPVRLALKVVDAACTPLAGATVKVWHTNNEGSYSGQTPNNGMCLQDQGYSASDFFRGAQVADDDGVVYFDTCFPGWYRGRAVHIHFQVYDGDTTYRISQLGFPAETTREIFGGEPIYSGYGQPDTTFAADNIFGRVSADERARLIFDVARMSDGAMLASKVVTVTG